MFDQYISQFKQCNAEVFPIPDLILNQGDTWNIIVWLPKYSPQRYTLTYIFIPSNPNPLGGTPTTITSIIFPEDTNKFQMLLVSTESYIPGKYMIQAYITEIATGYRTTLESVEITVKPDFSTMASGIDTRTYNQKMLDAINTALLNDTNLGYVEYAVAGRSYRKNRADLEKEKIIYELKCKRENGLGFSTKISYRF